MSGQSLGGDIRLTIAMKGHRKVKRLHRALGGDGCWSLVCLWMFAGDQHWDGDLSGLSDADLEEEAWWEGEPGAFIAALIEHRLLAGPAGKRRVHDWADHQPFAAQRGARAEAGRAAAQIRWERERARKAGMAETRATPDDDVPPAVPDGCDPHATRMPGAMPPTQPNPTSTTKLPPDPSHASAREPAPADAVYPGGFEPAVPRETPANPAVPLAVALNGAGFRCTAMNPKLIAFAQAGGTAEHLLQVAALPECAGKPAGYVAGFALREHLDGTHAGSTALVVAGSSPSPRRPASKTASGFLALEKLKHG